MEPECYRPLDEPESRRVELRRVPHILADTCLRHVERRLDWGASCALRTLEICMSDSSFCTGSGVLLPIPAPGKAHGAWTGWNSGNRTDNDAPTGVPRALMPAKKWRTDYESKSRHRHHCAGSALRNDRWCVHAAGPPEGGPRQAGEAARQTGRREGRTRPTAASGAAARTTGSATTAGAGS